MKEVVQQEFIEGYDYYLISEDGKVKKESFSESKSAWRYDYPKIRIDELGREYVMLIQDNKATKHYIASLILETYDEKTLIKYLLARKHKNIQAL